MNILVIGVITHDTLTIYRGSELWQQITSDMTDDIISLHKPAQLDFFAKMAPIATDKAYPMTRQSCQYWKPKFDRTFRKK